MSSTARRIREVAAKVEEEVAKFPGAKLVNIERKKHLRIHIEVNGLKSTIFTGSTPGDHRAEANMMTFVRRKLREMAQAANTC